MGKANNTENVLCQLKKYILTFLKRGGIELKKNPNVFLEVFIMKLSQKAIFPLIILHRCNQKHGHLYSYQSQKTILRKLGSVCSYHICRRSLNYILKTMESHGLIRRIRRHRRTARRGMEFHSTLYEITRLGYNLLWRMGIITKGIFNAIQNAIRNAMSKKKKPCAKNMQTHGFQCDFRELVTSFIDSG